MPALRPFEWVLQKATYADLFFLQFIILLDPISFLVAVYLSIVYALTYMLFTIYPIVFQQRRGWSAGVGALPLIGQLVGALFAGAMVLYESTLGRKRMLAGIPRTPEERMPLAAIGSTLFPITMCKLSFTVWLTVAQS